MSAKTQTKPKEIPKKLPPRPKELREDLLKRKFALEAKGWKFDTEHKSGFKRFEKQKVNAELKGAVSYEHLFTQAEALEESYTEKNIESEKQTEHRFSADSVEKISILSIVPSDFEPQKRRRKNFITEKGKLGIEELGDSIVKDGLLQPILLRPLARANGYYEIVFGERRWLAHRAKGITEIRSFIQNLTDAQVIELNYKENHNRLEPDALTDAFTFQFLIDNEGYTEEKLADHFATTLKNVRLKLRLNELIPEAREELASGELPLKHAYYIATFSEVAQKEIVEAGYIYKYGESSYGAAPFDDFKEEVEENITRRLCDASFDTSDERLHLQKLKCGDCPDNSDNQPLLFDDRLGENAVCLNKKCFEFKSSVHLRLKQEEIALESNRNADVPIGTKIAELNLVSAKSHVDKKELPVKGKILTDQTLLDEPECEFSEIAMAVDGEKKAQKVYVCRNEKCPVHRPKPPAKEESEISEADLVAEKNKFEREVSNQLRTEVFTEALKFFDDVRVLWQFDDLVQKLIVAFLWETRYSSAQFFSTLKKLGYAPKDLKDRREVEKFAASLDKAGQSRILFLLACNDELFVNHGFTGSDAETAEIRKITASFTKLGYTSLDGAIRKKLTEDN